MPASLQLPDTQDRPGDPDPSGAVVSFVLLDRIGATAAILFIVVVNGFFVRNTQVWWLIPPLVILVGLLTVADRLVRSGRLLPALFSVAVGNWMVAVIVPIILPFLWPVMVITILMPLVLASPHLSGRDVVAGVAAAALAVAAVASIGLLNDDAGAIEDIDDGAELAIVIGAISAQIAPIGLIIWQHNRLQRKALTRVTGLLEELVASEHELEASRRRVVDAADTERRRIERDLHDGAQQRLVALGVRLRLLESQVDDDAELHAAIEKILHELDEAIDEVRRLAHGIYPPLLQTQGLVPALAAVARRSSLEIRAQVEDIGRLEPGAETALYFTALEAITNAGKHAPGSTIDLRMGLEGDTIEMTIVDDGPGFEVTEVIRSHGTHNMGDRLAVVGGTLVIESELGAGTTVTARSPYRPLDPVAGDSTSTG